jgi:hypothetical protein
MRINERVKSYLGEEYIGGELMRVKGYYRKLMRELMREFRELISNIYCNDCERTIGELMRELMKQTKDFLL